jgi:hypothetical protein
MGRGRAKAKQTKVARDLKYSSPQTDFDRLRQELSGSGDQEAEQSEGDDPWLDEHR